MALATLSKPVKYNDCREVSEACERSGSHPAKRGCCSQGRVDRHSSGFEVYSLPVLPSFPPSLGLTSPRTRGSATPLPFPSMLEKRESRIMLREQPEELGPGRERIRSKTPGAVTSVSWNSYSLRKLCTRLSQEPSSMAVTSKPGCQSLSEQPAASMWECRNSSQKDSWFICCSLLLTSHPTLFHQLHSSPFSAPLIYRSTRPGSWA